VQPPSSEPQSSPKSQKAGLWGAVGCLSIAVLACGSLLWWMQSSFGHWLAQSESPLRGVGSRIFASQVVKVAANNCQSGEVQGDALRWFHPSASKETRRLVCTIDVSALADSERPDAVSERLLSETEQAALAEQAGLDPAQCYRYTSEAWILTGCFDTTAEGPMPYKILEITEPER
jgi:hypothetical protein